MLMLMPRWLAPLACIRSPRCGGGKEQFMDRGAEAEVFGGKDELRASERQVADLERMLGHKEVELAPLEALYKTRAVTPCREEH